MSALRSWAREAINWVLFHVGSRFVREGIWIGPHENLKELKGHQRSVEYFWATRELSYEDKRILDVGIVGSLYTIYLARIGHEVWGVDVLDYPYDEPNFRFVSDDARELSQVPDEYFDIVLCISTIEHIGLEKDDQGTTHVVDDEGDFKTIRAMARKLKPGGKLVLTTHYGAGDIHHQHLARNYDGKRLAQLIEHSGLVLDKQDFFKYYYPTHLELGNQIEMDRTGDYGTFPYAIVCNALLKPAI